MTSPRKSSQYLQGGKIIEITLQSIKASLVNHKAKFKKVSKKVKPFI